jgi:hypothetical protein
MYLKVQKNSITSILLCSITRSKEKEGEERDRVTYRLTHRFLRPNRPPNLSLKLVPRFEAPEPEG